ncbi:MAG: hypothetical protein ACOC4J_02775 [Bacteroidota bacterium]
MSKKTKQTEKNKVQEPIADYGQPLNFDKVWLMFQETDKKFQDTNRQLKDTDKRIKKLNDLFTSQWGRLIESLVEGDLVKLLRNFGIPINRTSERIKGTKDGEDFEFDILAHTGDIVVVVEVKTTLRPDDVNEFKEKMQKIKRYLPEYANNKIVGAMAYLTAQAAADKMAMKDGFIVIRATGNSASIQNKKGFRLMYF